MKPCNNMELDSKIQTSKNIFSKKKIDEFVFDETLFKIGSPEFIWF
jgi:hypothetical protein